MHFGFKLHDSKSLERGRLIVLKLDPVNDGTDFLRCRSFGSLFYALLCYFDCTYRPTNERKRIWTSSANSLLKGPLDANRPIYNVVFDSGPVWKHNVIHKLEVHDAL